MALFKKKPHEKKFKLDAVDIKQVLPFDGPCFATDKITVDGLSVGWFYRDLDENSPGWVFMSGTEGQSYMDNPSNSAIYSLNTIARPNNSAIAHNTNLSSHSVPPSVRKYSSLNRV